MKTPNVLQATIEVDNKTFTLSHILELKSCTCLETGRRIDMTRTQFRNFIKQKHGTFHKQLKLGEYVNINTGNVEKLFGID